MNLAVTIACAALLSTACSPSGQLHSQLLDGCTPVIRRSGMQWKPLVFLDYDPDMGTIKIDATELTNNRDLELVDVSNPEHRFPLDQETYTLTLDIGKTSIIIRRGSSEIPNPLTLTWVDSTGDDPEIFLRDEGEGRVRLHIVLGEHQAVLILADHGH